MSSSDKRNRNNVLLTSESEANSGTRVHECRRDLFGAQRERESLIRLRLQRIEWESTNGIANRRVVFELLEADMKWICRLPAPDFDFFMCV